MTATLPGIAILALLLERVTVDPPPGATSVSVTLQLAVPGALMVAGEQVRELTCRVTVRPMVAAWVIPLSEAVTVAL